MEEKKLKRISFLFFMMITISLLSVPSHAEVKNEFNMILPAGDKEITNIANFIVKQLGMAGIDVNLFYLPVEDYFPQLMEDDFWDMSLFLYPKIELRDYRHIYSNNSFFGDKILKINSIVDELSMMNTSVSIFDLIDRAKSYDEIEELVSNLTEIYFDKLLYDIPLLAVQEFAISNVDGFNLTKGYWESLSDINQNFSIYYPEANPNPFFITDETRFTSYLLHTPLFYSDQFGNLSPGIGKNITMMQYNDSQEINFVIDGKFGNESITFDDLDFTLELLQLSKTNSPDKEFHKRISFQNNFDNTSLVISNFTFFDFESLSRLFIVPKIQLNTQLHAIEGEDIIEFAPLSNRLDPFTSFEFFNYFRSSNTSGNFLIDDDGNYIGDEKIISVYSDEDPQILFQNNITDILVGSDLEHFSQSRTTGEQMVMLWNSNLDDIHTRIRIKRIFYSMQNQVGYSRYSINNDLIFSFSYYTNIVQNPIPSESVIIHNMWRSSSISNPESPRPYYIIFIPIISIIYYLQRNKKIRNFIREFHY